MLEQDEREKFNVLPPNPEVHTTLLRRPALAIYQSPVPLD